MSSADRSRRRISRRALLRTAGAFVGTPLALAFASLVRRYAETRPSRRQITVPAVRPGEIVFLDEAIVCRDARRVRVFSSRCPHLGCRISRAADDVLVCPCHGSRFRLDGSVVAGPASRPLEALPYEVDPRTGALLIHVS